MSTRVALKSILALALLASSAAMAAPSVTGGDDVAHVERAPSGKAFPEPIARVAQAVAVVVAAERAKLAIRQFPPTGELAARVLT